MTNFILFSIFPLINRENVKEYIFFFVNDATKIAIRGQNENDELNWRKNDMHA